MKYYKLVKNKKTIGMALDREEGDCDYFGEIINGAGELQKDESLFVTIADCEAATEAKAIEISKEEYEKFLQG